VAFEAGDYKKFVAGAAKAKSKPPPAKKGRKAPTSAKKKGKRAAAPKAGRDVPLLVVAMTALLRSSELVDNKYKSAANRAPIMLSDLRFVHKTASGDEVDIEVLIDGTLPARAGSIECRMPPSKSGPIQRSGNELIFPCRLDRQGSDGAMENIVNFMNAYPIDREFHHITPLLREKREGAQRQITRAEFIRDF
jgi:hypothetical protein